MTLTNDVLEFHCPEKYIESCIEENTFNLTELVDDVTCAGSILDKVSWKKDLTHTWPGMCYTMVPPDNTCTTIRIYLNSSKSFIVFIHDITFYIYNYNPQAIPMTTWILNKKKKRFTRLSIVETRMTELNTLDDSCQEDPTYDFQACVKENLSNTVGCRLKWDTEVDESLPYCATMEQFKSVFKLLQHSALCML